jgi:TRAP-type C4-dicarboxylate transport system permease small subunit
MLRAFLDRLYLYCGYLAAVFMVGIGVVVVLQVAWRMRGLTLDATEAAGFCMAAATFLGLAHTFRHGTHVRIGLFLARLPPGSRQAFEVGNCVLGLALVGFLAWHSTAFALQSLEFNDISPGLLAMPMWIPQAGVALGIIVLAIALLDELVHVLRGGRPHYEPEREDLSDRPVA